jgi:uncharacterized protein
MQFIWDEAKRNANLSKHGLDFRDAYRVFAGEVFRREDDRYHYDEQRMIAIGTLESVVVLIVHVESDDTIRIISMRRADKHETNIYYEYITSI